MANKLLVCFFYFILRLGEARVSMTSIKGNATEKVQESLSEMILNVADTFTVK